MSLKLLEIKSPAGLLCRSRTEGLYGRSQSVTGAANLLDFIMTVIIADHFVV